MTDFFNDGIGKIELIDVMGSDLSVANAARVSFGKGADFAKQESVLKYFDTVNSFNVFKAKNPHCYSSQYKALCEQYPPEKYTEEYYFYLEKQVNSGNTTKILKPEDFKLINYLAKHQHMSPFRHAQLQFAVKVPEFVGRQHWKHIVGVAYSGEGWNELSMRYTEILNEFYVPKQVKGQSSSNKQCSAAVLENSEGLRKFIDESNQAAFERYLHLIEQGVSRETARGVLPLNTYTQYYMTASLEAVCHFIKLRRSSGAQGEIRELAEAMFKLVQPLFPCSVAALLGGTD